MVPVIHPSSSQSTINSDHFFSKENKKLKKSDSEKEMRKHLFLQYIYRLCYRSQWHFLIHSFCRNDQSSDKQKKRKKNLASSDTQYFSFIYYLLHACMCVCAYHKYLFAWLLLLQMIVRSVRISFREIKQKIILDTEIGTKKKIEFI